jgi:hypothetical protein
MKKKKQEKQTVQVHQPPGPKHLGPIEKEKPLPPPYGKELQTLKNAIEFTYAQKYAPTIH